MLDIKVFLGTYADKRFAWGEDDCCLFLADWFEANRGWDPAAHLRRRYRDAAGCHRLVFWSGGIVRLVAAVAKKAGLRRVQPGEVEHGDVAVIRVGRQRAGWRLWPEPTVVVGAIRSGHYWAVRNERVGFVSKAKVIAAWRI